MSSCSRRVLVVLMWCLLVDDRCVPQTKRVISSSAFWSSIYQGMDIDIHALALDSPGTAGNVAESEPMDCSERASSAQVWQLTFSTCGVLLAESRNSLLVPHITLLLSYVANYIYGRTVLSSSVNLFFWWETFSGAT